MTLAHWLSPNLMRSLAWALLHFLWQGTALAALAVLGTAYLRRASARYVLAVACLFLMLAAPVVTFFSYWQPEASPYQAPEPASYIAPAAIHPSTAAPRVAAHRIAPDVFPWMVEAWLAGVAFFGLRATGGFILLERMRRKESIAVGIALRGTCLALQRRLGLRRVIAYCHCHWLDAPAVIGWFRPIVLLPVTALTGLSEAQLRAVIAHELAHIKRFDSFVNAFQVGVETVLFYHPAVWWLNHRIRVEREHCCDDVAISLCGDAVDYARALTLMEEWREAPALAMASNRGSLTVRVTRLLGINQLGSSLQRGGVTAAAVCLVAALIAGNAFLGIVHPVSAQTQPNSPPTAPGPSVAATAPASPRESSRPTSPAPQVKPSPVVVPVPDPVPQAEPKTAGSYIDGMKSAGLGDITVDQLIAMKIQGVTPDYVRGLRAQGVQPDVEKIVAMRIQDVTPEYVRDLRSLGLDLTDDRIIAMKIQGVSGDYVRALQSAGMHPDSDTLLAMRIQGVTPDYIRGLHDQGFKANEEEIVSMRIQGVTPEYARDVRALGLQPTTEELIAMRIQQVTPEYIKALQAAGLKFTVDELIRAKIQGITPEFVDQASKHGFKNLTLDKLIQLKNAGVFQDAAEI